jgi:hypothetical protein
LSNAGDSHSDSEDLNDDVDPFEPAPSVSFLNVNKVEKTNKRGSVMFSAKNSLRMSD